MRPDWLKVNIAKVRILVQSHPLEQVLICYRLKMEKVVYLKFTQHPSLKEELLATGEAPLVEVRKPPSVPLQPV